MSYKLNTECDICGCEIPVAGYNFGEKGSFVSTPTYTEVPQSIDVCYKCYGIYEKVLKIKEECKE